MTQHVNWLLHRREVQIAMSENWQTILTTAKVLWGGAIFVQRLDAFCEKLRIFCALLDPLNIGN
jgi:hypothetical protein